MKILTCLFITAASLAAQSPAKPAARPPAKAASKAPSKAAVVDVIPKDAVATATGLYRWTDKDGKVWTYRRTPFGVTRYPGDPLPDKHDTADVQTTAREEGDSIRFERSSPFGKRTWLRKKTELNESEQAIWATQQKNKSATHAAEEKE